MSLKNVESLAMDTRTVSIDKEELPFRKRSTPLSAMATFCRPESVKIPEPSIP
jgi:hypothetical protein